MHTLTALVLAVPGQPAPSLAEIAATPGLAATFVVAAGTAGELHRRGQLVEALRLRSAVLLLFEDPCEASEFEKAVADARAAAHRQKGKMLGPAWRRRHPLSASPGGAG